MEFNNRLRGQTSIEFMVLILIAIIYIQAVVQPNIVKGVAALNDTQRITQTKIEAQKIANSIEEIALISGEARKNIAIFLPKGSSLDLKNEKITATVSGLDGDFSKNWTLDSCTKEKCSFNIPVYSAQMQISGQTTISNEDTKTKIFNLTIEKNCNDAGCGIDVAIE